MGWVHDSTSIHLSSSRKALSFCGLQMWDLRQPVTGSEHPNPEVVLEILVTVLRSCSTELLLHGEAWPAASGAFVLSSAFLKSVNQGASLKTRLGLSALYMEHALKTHGLCWGDSGSLNEIGWSLRKRFHGSTNSLLVTVTDLPARP